MAPKEVFVVMQMKIQKVCEACEGYGKLYGGPITLECEDCHGTGWVDDEDRRIVIAQKDEEWKPESNSSWPGVSSGCWGRSISYFVRSGSTT